MTLIAGVRHSPSLAETIPAAVLASIAARPDALAIVEPDRRLTYRELGELVSVSTRAMMAAGVFFLPSDRKEEGLMLSATAQSNIGLAVLDRRETRNGLGLTSPKAIGALTSDIGKRVDLTEAFLSRTTSKLSGGNQQKILFGKSFGRDYDIYILDEPTVGVDVGTRAALYRIIKAIAEAGKAVVVISSDLPEVMHLAHRLITFRNGRISGEFEGDSIREQAILGAFFDQERKTA